MKTASDIRLTNCMQHSMLQILCGLLLRLWIQRGACSVPADVFTWNSSSGFGIANAAPAAAHRIWRSYVGAARSGHEPDGKLGLKWPQNTWWGASPIQSCHNCQSPLDAMLLCADWFNQSCMSSPAPEAFGHGYIWPIKPAGQAESSSISFTSHGLQLASDWLLIPRRRHSRICSCCLCSGGPSRWWPKPMTWFRGTCNWYVHERNQTSMMGSASHWNALQWRYWCWNPHSSKNVIGID